MLKSMIRAILQPMFKPMIPAEAESDNLVFGVDNLVFNSDNLTY
jgi:hypothetical protein